MRYLIIPLLVIGIFLGAAPALAVDFLPLVQCGTTPENPCTPCELFATFKRAIDFVLIGLTGPVAAFMVVLAGGMMLLAGGRPGTFAQGQKMLTNTLMGVAVILLAWVATNFLIKSLGEGSGDDAWYTFSCPEFLEGIEQEGTAGEPTAPQSGPGRPPAALVEANKKVCGDESALAKQFGLTTGVKQKNAPELDALIACLKKDPIVLIALDNSQIYTYEKDNPLCNLTRGTPICGRCAHSKYSCHYGGRTGTTGALGADLNWNRAFIMYDVETRTKVTGKTCPPSSSVKGCKILGSEADLFDAIYCSAVRNECEFGLLNFEGDHTHISTTTCDVDAKDGVKGRPKPVNCEAGGGIF